jgi:hypothetical protein
MQQAQYNRRIKPDIPVNDWTLKKERLLRYWQEECRLYNWLYIQNVETYQQINKVLSLTSIILSSVTGTTLLNQSNETGSSADGRILIAFGIISLLAGMVSSVKEFMNLGAKINSNINCARQNSCIVNDIDEQLNMDRSERINGREFMKTIKDRKNDLIQNGPMIPRSKWNKLQKQINSGQGINFFNKKLFQEYMEQTINVGDIDFHMPGDDNGSPESPRNTDIVVSKGRQTVDAPTVPQTVTFASRIPTPPPLHDKVLSGIATTITHVDTIQSSSPVEQEQPGNNNTGASEDEYIANMNDENLCAGTLRQMLEESEQPDSPVTTRRLFRFRSKGKRNHKATSAIAGNTNAYDGYLSDPDLEQGRSRYTNLHAESSSKPSKYDPLLQYQLTRL